MSISCPCSSTQACATNNQHSREQVQCPSACGPCCAGHCNIGRSSCPGLPTMMVKLIILCAGPCFLQSGFSHVTIGESLPYSGSAAFVNGPSMLIPHCAAVPMKRGPGCNGYLCRCLCIPHGLTRCSSIAPAPGERGSSAQIVIDCYRSSPAKVTPT